jgi:hypothetical protein
MKVFKTCKFPRCGRRFEPFDRAQGRLREAIEPFDGTQGWLIERPIAAVGCHKPDKSSKFPEIESWRSSRVAVR